MKSKYEQRVAMENAAARAVARATQPPERPPLPNRALIGERLADHGEDSGAEGRKRMADELASLVGNVAALRRNPTLNAAQIELAVADRVRGRVDRLQAECDEQERAIDVEARGLEQATDDALGAQRPEWHVLATEYRNALLDMDDEQRHDFIDRLQGTRHAPVLRWAIGSVPPELSGVSAGVQKQMQDMILAIKDPSLITRPGDLRRRRAALAKVRDGIARTAAELVDMDAADNIRALTGEGSAQ